MTETFNKIDHSKFGGLIYLSDFNTNNRGKDNTSGSLIARRIANDQQFDKQCKKNEENRERCKNYEK